MKGDLDFSRMDKGELRCLIEELLGEGLRCSPQMVATARWRAADARAKRLWEVEGAALRDYLDAYQHEKDASEARRSSVRLTKMRADAEIIWARARRSANDAEMIASRRWEELQTTWEVKGAAQ